MLFFFKKKIFICFNVILLFFTFIPSLNSQEFPGTFADLVEELMPSVVNISTTQIVEDQYRSPEFQFPPGSPFEDLFRDFFNKEGQKKQRKATSLGSGFVIDESGYIVTNNHVIGNADQIEVIFQDDTRLEAELIGKDSKVDLAVLKVKSNKKLKAIKWGDSKKTKVGDWVLAIGNPFGLGGTVTAGIISAKSRDIAMGAYDSFIQTDASINKGNSGGPMFNIKGEVIGINTAIFSPSGGSVGIGFAIPTEMAEPVINQLKEFGKTSRGWLGVRIQTVTDEIAEAYGLKKASGALIASVTENSPSSRAGIKPGDIILKFDDKEIRKSKELPRVVAATKVGKTVDVVIWRGKKQIILKVKLGELESFEKIEKADVKINDKNKIKNLGLQLTKITPNVRIQFNIPKNIQGVLILQVDNNSIAAEKGLKAGDVILAVVNNDTSQTHRKVFSPIDVINAVKKAKQDGKKIILLYVHHLNSSPGYVPLRIVN